MKKLTKNERAARRFLLNRLGPVPGEDEDPGLREKKKIARVIKRVTALLAPDEDQA